MSEESELGVRRVSRERKGREWGRDREVSWERVERECGERESEWGE